MSERSRCRIQITFREEDPVKYISHLDLIRAWERILRRAGMPVAYSQGFNPHPRITVAMPLPVGCTGEREIIDVLLDEPLSAAQVILSLDPALPPGISVVEARHVPLTDPPLPSLICKAHYQLTLTGIPRAVVEGHVTKLMDRKECLVEFRRKTFDLRPLIGSLAVCGAGDRVTLEADLLRNPRGRIGRPDVLLQALGLSEHARRMHRTRIVFAPHAPK
jgi:radical SAM-linked protein